MGEVNLALKDFFGVWAGLGLVWAVGCNLSAWTCPVSIAERGIKVLEPRTGKAECFRVSFIGVSVSPHTNLKTTLCVLHVVL